MNMKIFQTLAARLCAFLAATVFSAPAFAVETGQPVPWEVGFQPSASSTKARMIWFHDDLLMPIITGIVLFVLALLVWIAVRYNARANPVPSKTTHNTLLEVVWTLVPVLILIVIVIPSMKMLYFVDRTHEAEMTLKVTGYQWYWGYEYPDHGGINFLANLVKDADLKAGQPRLLATDNPVVLPVDTNIRILTAASDVIHSWAVPAFGVKMDAVPGRLNETWVRITQEGTFYGQCSELCGLNHGFMPIEVHAVSKAKFAEWVRAQGGKMPETGATQAGAHAAGVTAVPGAAMGGISAKDGAPTEGKTFEQKMKLKGK
jgi:cytochrome c oxidase subunit 2